MSLSASQRQSTVAVGGANLVTVPALDARFAAFEARVEVRFAELRNEMQAFKAELVRWVFLVMLGNVALTAGATALLNALQRTH